MEGLEGNLDAGQVLQMLQSMQANILGKVPTIDDFDSLREQVEANTKDIRENET